MKTFKEWCYHWIDSEIASMPEPSCLRFLCHYFYEDRVEERTTELLNFQYRTIAQAESELGYMLKDVEWVKTLARIMESYIEWRKQNEAEGKK